MSAKTKNHKAVEKTEKPQAAVVEETKVEQPILLTTKQVAAMVGTTPKALRRVLRAKWYNDGEHTNYAWAPGDATLKAIVDFYAAKKAAPKATEVQA